MKKLFFKNKRQSHSGSLSLKRMSVVSLNSFNKRNKVEKSTQFSSSLIFHFYFFRNANHKFSIIAFSTMLKDGCKYAHDKRIESTVLWHSHWKFISLIFCLIYTVNIPLSLTLMIILKLYQNVIKMCAKLFLYVWQMRNWFFFSWYCWVNVGWGFVCVVRN